MAHLSENREIVHVTRAIADLVQAQNLNSKKDAAKLPTNAITDLEPSDITQLFFLKDDEPTVRERCLTDAEIVEWRMWAAQRNVAHVHLSDPSIIYSASKMIEEKFLSLRSFGPERQSLSDN
ncbi:hypothetical protein N7465_004825 [Penicillium sp. CMV-2018d]|nr:hypothetical protein N7465_004825 [Penicillium sp. CMV-2018d]